MTIVLAAVSSSSIGPAMHAGGDFNSDGFDDLAIGAPFEGISGEPGAGAIHVLYGSSNGPSNIGSQFWHQNAPGVRDQAETGDQFGSSLGR